MKAQAKVINQAATFSAITFSDEQALEVQQLYREWGEFTDGTKLYAASEKSDVTNRVNYKNVLYNVITMHVKQSSWNPKDAPFLFAKVLIPDPEAIPEWEQPESTNGYSIGDKVMHNGKTWESLEDNNVWEPGAVGTDNLWKEVQQ